MGWWDSPPPSRSPGGPKTTKEVFRMVPRHVSDSPRRTQDGPRRRQGSQDGSKALFRRPKTDPKSRKIHGKLMLRAIPIPVSFFFRFLIDFQSNFRPQKFDFVLELYRFYSSFGLSGFIRIKWILQCIFEPTWFGFGCQKSKENRQMVTPSGFEQLIDFDIVFFIDFGTVFGVNLEPFRLPFSVQNGAEGVQDAPKTRSRRSKTLPKTSRMAQDGPRRLQTCPRAFQTSILVTRGLNFDDFLTKC